MTTTAKAVLHLAALIVCSYKPLLITVLPYSMLPLFVCFSNKPFQLIFLVVGDAVTDSDCSKPLPLALQDRPVFHLISRFEDR